LDFQILDIRHLEADQFAPLLVEESKTWRDELRWDFEPSARQISNCLQEKRLSGYALALADQIRGYCFFFNDGEKGFIGDLFVEPASAKIELARRLLDHSIEKLMRTPGLRRIEAQLPHFTYEQLESCFLARCFKAYRRCFMSVALIDRPPRRPLAGPTPSPDPTEGQAPLADFLLVPWDRKHDREAGELLCTVYHHHIDTAINDQYGSAEGTRRLIENIVYHRGCGEFLPRASLVALHRSTRSVAGVLALTAVGRQNAHIPQIAVAAQFQATGLGTAMLESSFQELTRQGYGEVSLTVTELNAGALRLYERLGFQTFRTFGAFAWEHP